MYSFFVIQIGTGLGKAES